MSAVRTRPAALTRDLTMYDNGDSASAPSTDVDALRSISLHDLNKVAALQTRTDRKYVVDREQLHLLLGTIGPISRALEIDGRRWMSYRSVYFDTPGLAAYIGAARSRPHRFKVRTRLYVDTGACFVEAKLKNANGQTVKDRLERSTRRLDRLTDADEAFLRQHAIIAPLVDELRPTLITEYRRATLLLGADRCGDGPDLAVDLGRMTIDDRVECSTWDGERVSIADRVLIETKSAGAPSPADRALWAMGIRPQHISKYASGLAALRPDLPSNKWRRVIDRHLR